MTGRHLSQLAAPAVSFQRIRREWCARALRPIERELAMLDSSTCRTGKRTDRPRHTYNRHMYSGMPLQSE